MFAVEAQVNRQSQRFTAPRRLHRQRQDDQIQAKTMHHLLPRGAHGIAPPRGALVFAAGLVEESVIQIERDVALGIKGRDQQLCQ